MKRDDDLPDTLLTGSEEHAVRLVQITEEARDAA